MSARPRDFAPRMAGLDGRYRDAGMEYESMRQHALRNGDPGMAARLALQASNCYHLAGKSLRSLTLLIEAFHHDPAEKDVCEIWDSHRQMFDFLRCFKPQLGPLQKQLGHMRLLCQHNPRLPLSDLLRCEAVVARGQGDHHQVFRLLERAWQHYRPGKKGLAWYIFAHNAAWSSLECGDREGADHWTRRSKDCDQDMEDACAGWWDMQIRLALWDHNVDLLRDGVIHLRTPAHPSEQSVWWRRAAGLRVRCLLIDPSWGDPQDVQHPARQQLCRPALATLEEDDIFHRVIVVVDYRLACLRYAVGLAPVEDLYHQYPARVPAHSLQPRMNSDDIHARVGRVQVAITRATKIVRSLDAVYRCQWRQDVVNERRRRLKAIQRGLPV